MSRFVRLAATVVALGAFSALGAAAPSAAQGSSPGSTGELLLADPHWCC